MPLFVLGVLVAKPSLALVAVHRGREIARLIIGRYGLANTVFRFSHGYGAPPCGRDCRMLPQVGLETDVTLCSDFVAVVKPNEGVVFGYEAQTQCAS